MSGGQNFQQRWGLRGRDDVDSSSDDSKSLSQDENVLRKHRLIPSSELPENGEIGNSQDNDAVPHKGNSSKFGKKSGKKRKENFATTKQIKKKQTKSDNTKRKAKKVKDTRVKYKPVSFDDLKLFSNSLIDELKSAREGMFTRMNEEMGITPPVLKSASKLKKKKDIPAEKLGLEKPKEKVELGKKAPKTIGSSSKKPVKSGKGKISKNSPDVIEDGVTNAKNLAPVSINEKNKTNSSNFLPKESAYSLARNLIYPGIQSGINIVQNEEMPPQGFFSGVQMPEQFQNMSQMGFQNMGNFNNQMRNNWNSPMGFPLNQGLRNGFGRFSNQAMENLSGGNDMLGQSAIRYAGGNNGFFGHFVGNNSGGKSD